jgi:hypothetical protein
MSGWEAEATAFMNPSSCIEFKLLSGVADSSLVPAFHPSTHWQGQFAGQTSEQIAPRLQTSSATWSKTARSRPNFSG